MDAIRPLLAEQGVSILFECEDILHVEKVLTFKGNTGADCGRALRHHHWRQRRTHVHKVSMIGEGQDAGDKAVYKAMTGRHEILALYKTFMVSTGDDPENEGAGKEPLEKPPERRRLQGSDGHPIISEPQRKTPAGNSRNSVGCNIEKLKVFVESHWGYTSSKDIQRRHYDAIVACVRGR